MQLKHAQSLSILLHAAYPDLFSCEPTVATGISRSLTKRERSGFTLLLGLAMQLIRAIQNFEKAMPALLFWLRLGRAAFYRSDLKAGFCEQRWIIRRVFSKMTIIVIMSD